MPKSRLFFRFVWTGLALVILLALFLVFQTTSDARAARSASDGGWLPAAAGLKPAVPGAQALSSSTDQIALSFSFAGVQAEPVKLAGGTYTRLSGQDLGSNAIPGQPELPFFSRDVQIPFKATYTLEITGSEYTEVKLADFGLPERVYPAQISQSKSGPVPPVTVPDAAAYATNAFLPTQPVQTGTDYIQRGRRGLSILLQPVQYNPAIGTLRIYSRIDVTLHLKGGDAALTRQMAERYASPDFEALQAATLLNYGLPGAEAVKLTDTPPGYLIITADTYATGLAPFVALKQAQGFAVTLATLTDVGGTTNTAIQTYIQNFYNTNPSLAYLLLVGDLQDDPDTMPTWNDQSSLGTHLTDLYYATLAGTDSIPDIGYGRFPVRDVTQLANMVNKALAYESLTGSEVWIKQAAFLGTSDSSYYPLAEATHNYVIDSYTKDLGYTGIFPANPQVGGDKLYAVTYHATTTNVMTSLNEGRSMIIYSGHGNTTSWAGPSVTQANVRSLTSTGVYAFVAGHACQTGIWNATESFAETWVIQENKGALVYLGASDNTYWDEDDVLERMMFDALFAESQPSISAMLAYGHTGVRALSGDTYGLYYREEYHIFGDPSIKLRLAPQPDFSLAANPTTVQFCSNGQGTTSLDLTSINDFSGQVDLIVTIKPAGVTATFNPTQVAPTGSSLLTLADDGSTMPFVYQVSVQGTSGSLTHTTDLTLFINSVQVATLLTPADDAADQWILPTFSWETMDGGMSYTFELDDAGDFVTPLLQVSLTEPTYTPSSPLQVGSTFYWRVRATNDCGETLSSVHNFTTTSVPPLYLYLPTISN